MTSIFGNSLVPATNQERKEEYTVVLNINNLPRLINRPDFRGMIRLNTTRKLMRVPEVKQRRLEMELNKSALNSVSRCFKKRRQTSYKKTNSGYRTTFSLKHLHILQEYGLLFNGCINYSFCKPTTNDLNLTVVVKENKLADLVDLIQSNGDEVKIVKRSKN